MLNNNYYSVPGLVQIPLTSLYHWERRQTIHNYNHNYLRLLCTTPYMVLRGGTPVQLPT